MTKFIRKKMTETKNNLEVRVNNDSFGKRFIKTLVLAYGEIYRWKNLKNESSGYKIYSTTIIALGKVGIGFGIYSLFN